MKYIKKFSFTTIAILSSLMLFYSCNMETKKDKDKDEYTVAVYYFPNYHVDERNEKYFIITKNEENEKTTYVKAFADNHFLHFVTAWYFERSERE